MRRLAFAAVAAVAATAVADPASVAPVAPVAPAAPAASPAPLAIGGSGPIMDVAITDDGAVAVSLDVSGHLRLWPSLDGKREPVAIAATPPTAFAITRDGDDVAIAGRDAAGGIELVRTSAAGVAESRAPLDAGRPVVAIAIAGDRVIATRDDGLLALFDLRGARTAILTPAPGERVARVAARHGRALALVATADGVRGRWIDLDGARWGDDTPALPIEPGFAELSPDLEHLAATAPARAGTGLRTVIVELATGKVTARPGPDKPQPGENVEPVGFADAGTLVLIDGGDLVWWRGGKLAGGEDLSFGFPRQGNRQVVVADRHTIASLHSDLVVMKPGSTRYLGYRLVGPEYVRAVHGGLIVSDGQSMVRTDAHLRQTRLVVAPPHDSSDPQLTIPIDARHALSMTGTYNARSINQVDLAHPDRAVAVATGEGVLAYEPSARIAAWIDGSNLRLAHVGPDGALSAPASLALAARNPWFFLLEPARAGGDVAVVFQGYPRTITVVTGFTDGGAVTTAPVIDDPDNKLTSRIEQGDLRPLGFGRYAPRRHGALTAEVEGPRLVLRDHGKVRWTVPSAGVRDVLWTPDGDLIGMGDGLARVDVATGAFEERQCGWVFGLYDEHTGQTDGAICDAP